MIRLLKAERLAADDRDQSNMRKEQAGSKSHGQVCSVGNYKAAVEAGRGKKGTGDDALEKRENIKKGDSKAR